MTDSTQTNANDPQKKKHIATELSLRSQANVHAHNRDAWLALFAQDGVIEDPIGPSPLDPKGKGHRTPAEREAFWDNFIARIDTRITIHHSYSVGNECANVVTLLNTFEHDGQRLTQEVNGVFTYAADSEGKIKSLRGYWDVDEAQKTIKPA